MDVSILSISESLGLCLNGGALPGGRLAGTEPKTFFIREPKKKKVETEKVVVERSRSGLWVNNN